jgi:hypothetical protein
MNYEIELETKLIKTYFQKDKENRLLDFIKNEKKRKKFISELNKNDVLKSELFEKLNGNELEIIKSKLNGNKKIQDCYVISEILELDGKRLEIEFALRKIIASDCESIVIFGDCDIVFVEKEGFNNRFISK